MDEQNVSYELVVGIEQAFRAFYNGLFTSTKPFKEEIEMCTKNVQPKIS